MKKLIPLLIILFVAAGCNKKTVNNQENPGNESNQNNQQDGTKTYYDLGHGFEFSYPEEFSKVEPAYGSLPNQLVQFSLLKEAYPNTNFGDAAFTVSTKQSPNEADCLSSNPPEGQSSFTNKETKIVEINGIKFYYSEGSGAGAGNLYESRAHRTYRDGNCFEFKEILHTSNVHNYEPGTVTEVNKAPIWEKLNKIFQSVKFGQNK